MDASVIIVNFNGRELLPACLESVPAGAETIVVDNGSTDGSPEEVARRWPAVLLVRNRVNRGFAAAVNQGIERSTRRFVCLLNPDARLGPDALRVLIEHLEADPQAGIVAPQLLHEDGRRQHSFAGVPSLATELLNKSLLRILFPARFPSKRQEHDRPVEVETVIGACMAVRRELIERIGGLDERFFLFLEETDWCVRARRAGARVVFVPAARVVHLQGRTRARVATRARIEYVRSLFAFFRKNRPASYPALRALFPLKNLIEVAFLTFGVPFSARTRRRWAETAALLGWQAAGCPRSWGLSGAAAPRYVWVAGTGHGWRVAEEAAETFRDFDRRVADVRVVKDLRHKRTVECRVEGRDLIIKIYKAGGLRRRLKSLLWGPRGLAELDACVAVLERGIPTVPVLAAGESGGESCAVFGRLEGWRQLQEVLLSGAPAGAARRRLLFLYGRFARRVHDAGIWQYDFNPTNVLVRGEEFKLIDFEKTRVRPFLAEGVRLRSLAKMNRIGRLSRADRLRFLRGYLDASAEDLGRWKEIAREILALGARQEARDADRSERRCVDDNRDFGPFEIAGVRGYYRKRRPGRPGPGLSAEELALLAREPGRNGGYRFEPAGDAVAAWKKANRKARSGGPAPVAVLFEKGGGSGKLVYPG